MQDLIAQERFEMEVLDLLNTHRFLRSLVFCGGTMLRLCHGLDRYSVDLDFWLRDPSRDKTLLADLSTALSPSYQLKDLAEKFHTFVVEFRSPQYPRSLKIEIRKKSEPFSSESAIAYSPHSTRQVLVEALTLHQMMASKKAAFLDRGEIRDAYDMEFLIKRGIHPAGDKGDLTKVLERIDGLSRTDYTVKLGSLIEPAKRAYYRDRNFRILKEAVQDRIEEL